MIMTDRANENVHKWLQSQDFHYNPVVGLGPEEEMLCMRCSGRGRLRTSLRDHRLPKVAMLEISSLALQGMGFNKPKRSKKVNKMHRAAVMKTVDAAFSPVSSSCGDAPRRTADAAMSSISSSSVDVSRKPKGRAQVLKERAARLATRPGNISSSNSLSRMSSLSDLSVQPVSTSHAKSGASDNLSISSHAVSDIRLEQTLRLEQTRLVKPQPAVTHDTVIQGVQEARTGESTHSGRISIHSHSHSGAYSVPGDPDIDDTTTASLSPSERFSDALPDKLNLFSVPAEDSGSDSDQCNYHNNIMEHDQRDIYDDLPQVRPRPWTLFETRRTDDGQKIIFEKHAKYDDLEPTFKGFKFEHLKTPETFTKEKDFPELPPTKAPVKPQPPQEVVVKSSLRDLASGILSDGKLPPSDDDYQNQYHLDSDSEEVLPPSSPVPTLVVDKLPPTLDDSQKDYLMGFLKDFGSVFLYEHYPGEKHSYIKVKYHDAETCQYAMECLDGSDALFNDCVLEASISPPSDC